MHIFSEIGTRGEVSYISNRCSKANNKYLKSYDQNKDQNNLYGYAMSKFLPLSDQMNRS